MTSNIITKNYEWQEIDNDISNNPIKWIRPDDIKYNYLERDVISRIFPNLNTNDKNILTNALVQIINFMYLKMARNNDDIFWNQLVQNNNIDLRAIVNLLLPYINDNEAEDNKKSLTALSELYLKQDSNGRYVYTNSQYNRCVRQSKKNDIVVYLRPFTIEYFRHHLDLLMMSIESASNKLYVNWINILPMTMTTYKNSQLYQDTRTKIIGRPDREITQVNLVKNYIDPNPGISYQDIYNVMSHHLYYEIRNYRWLIYDIIVNNMPITYIDYLEKTIDFDNFYKKKLWTQLSVASQNRFSSQWKKFYDSQDNSDNIILHHFYFYFAKYHRNSAKLIAEGKLELTMNIGDEAEDAEDDIIITPETTRNAQQGFANTPIDEIYLFLLDQINAFRVSWFYYFLKIKKQKYISQGNNIYITPKNIYNYSKSMVHHVNRQNKFTPLPKYWISLKPEYINMIMYRLLDIPNSEYNDWNRNNWFNINNYFRRIYPQFAESELKTANFNMHKLVRDNLVDIIFESLIYHGLLTQLLPNPDITNKSIIRKNINSDNEEKINEYRRSKMREYYFTTRREDYGSNAYYYLTGESYNKLPVNYFDYLTTAQIWTFTYAMNWVSQINFYHHYTNNRVIYITGATGVGKSTQIPKLLMYSQKMLDYNNNGKIICTQPRVEPTVNNANTISTELGVPITQKIPQYENAVFTNMYYVQYQHQLEKHVSNTASFLRIVTDGTLLEQIIQYPFMTRSLEDIDAYTDSTNEADWVRIYRANNIYDTIIVDEAHEHNANMDMILTLARDAAYVNNNLKLVIVSATMEDDEPIYRRYYRNINDNRAYPLSAYIENNIIDRANMDRRIHISEPGATTQYKITDHYLPKSQADLINENNFVTYGIQKALDVINSTTQGDVLVFMTGKKEIKQTVSEINANTAANIIAFGYYSELTDEQKNFIRNIHETLPKYTRFKDDVDLAENNVTRRVPMGTYNRAVIVATNVAEASITLKRLRYVVDTGYANVSTYDPITDQSRLIKMPISWSSSQQRRGRVGRVAAGDVYYLYDREKIINNKTAYTITNIDIMNLMIKLLKQEPDDANIITPLNDINNIENLLKLYKKVDADGNMMPYKIFTNPHPYMDIIRRQYLYEPDLNDASQYYKYFGKSSLPVDDQYLLAVNPLEYMLRNHDDYHFQMDPEFGFYSKNYTGYDDYQLEDDSLDFYLIHPDENIIVRDQYTGKLKSIRDSATASSGYIYNIMKINNIQNKSDLVNLKNSDFKFLKYDIAMRNAESELLVNNVPASDIDIYIYYRDIPEEASNDVEYFFNDIAGDTNSLGTIRVKSSFLSNIQQLASISKLDIFNDTKKLLWYSYAIPLGLENDVLGIITLINDQGDVTQLVEEKRLSRVEIEKFFYKHLAIQGDIYTVWKLWIEIREILKNNGYNDLDIGKQQENYFILQKNKYLTGQPIDRREYIIFNKMYGSGQLGSMHEFYYYISNYKIEYVLADNTTTTSGFNNVITDRVVQEIQSLAKIHTYDMARLLNAIIQYLNYSSQIYKNDWLNKYKIENGLAENDEQLFDPFEWADIHLSLPKVLNYSDVDAEWLRVLESYLRAYSMNAVAVAYPYYINLKNNVVYQPDYWSKFLAIEKTFLKNKLKFMVYQHESITGDSIAYQTPVKLEWLLNLNPVYYYYLFFDKTHTINFRENPKKFAKIYDLDEYKNKYDFGLLYQYLDIIDDKFTTKQIHNSINRDVIKKIDNFIINEI